MPVNLAIVGVYVPHSWNTSRKPLLDPSCEMACRRLCQNSDLFEPSPFRGMGSLTIRIFGFTSLLACEVTDGGLASLESISALREIYLAETRVTAAAVERLRQRLPRCRVEH